MGGNDGVDFVRFGNAGRVYRFGRAGVSFRNHQSFIPLGGRPRRLLAPGALWLDERCARGCRVRCDDVNGVNGGYKRIYRVRLRLLPRRRRRCVPGATTMGPEGCDRDRASIVSRVYLGWEKTRSLPGWWSGQFFFLVICASECARFGRLTMNHSCVFAMF